MSTPTAVRIAAILLWVNAFGFGLPCLLAIRNLLAGRSVPTIMGFPAYGARPLERLGVHTTFRSGQGSCSYARWRPCRISALGPDTAATPFSHSRSYQRARCFWWGFALPLPTAVRARPNSPNPA